MSRRLQLANLLERSGSLTAILKLRARSPVPWLSILTYHRFPSRDGMDPFDDGVVDITAEEFERQVRCMKKHFNVVGVPELCAFATGRPLPKNPVAITFDDGYLCNYRTALPILKKYDCKAIFFVSTAVTTERRVHWWDRIAYLVKQSSRRELRIEYPEPATLHLAGVREDAIRTLLRIVKVHPSLDLPRFLAEVGRAADVAWSPELERQFSDRLLMTWDHVRAMQKAGMDVQSHTRTHRVLQTLSPSELRDELEGSRDDLKREIGVPARAIAYPVGTPLGPSSPVRTALARSRYEIGLTNGTGPTPVEGVLDRFGIRRHTVGLELSNALFLTMLALPQLTPPRTLPCSSALEG